MRYSGDSNSFLIGNYLIREERKKWIEKFEHKKALKYNDLRAFSEFQRRGRDYLRALDGRLR